MALILSFPFYKTSIPKKNIAREEQILIQFPVKPSELESHPDWEEQMFEMELERVRAKCDLNLSVGKAESNISIKDRLVTSLSKSWRFFASVTLR